MGRLTILCLRALITFKFIQHLFCSLVFDVVYSVQRIGFIYKADKAMPLNRSEKLKGEKKASEKSAGEKEVGL